MTLYTIVTIAATKPTKPTQRDVYQWITEALTAAGIQWEALNDHCTLKAHCSPFDAILQIRFILPDVRILGVPSEMELVIIQ